MFIFMYFFIVLLNHKNWSHHRAYTNGNLKFLSHFSSSLAHTYTTCSDVTMIVVDTGSSLLDQY